MSHLHRLKMPTFLTRIFEVFEEWVPALLMGVMTLSITIDVIMRYVFNSPVMGASETAMFSMVWMVYLGAGAVSRKGAHICLDFFSSRISAKTRAILDILVELLTIAVLLTITIATFKYMQDSKFVPIPGIGFSKKFITLAAAVGLSLMIIHTVMHMLRAFAGFTDKNYERINEPIEDVDLDEFNTLFIKTIESDLIDKETVSADSTPSGSNPSNSDNGANPTQPTDIEGGSVK